MKHIFVAYRRANANELRPVFRRKLWEDEERAVRRLLALVGKYDKVCWWVYDGSTQRWRQRC